MGPVRKLAFVLIAGAALAAGAGCMKLKLKTTVYPDGSGKMETTIGVSEKMAARQRANGEEARFSNVEPADVTKMEEQGVVMTRPETYKEGGYEYVKLTAYFIDVNKLSLGGMGFMGQMPLDVKQSFKKLEDGSYELTFSDPDLAKKLQGGLPGMGGGAPGGGQGGEGGEGGGMPMPSTPEEMEQAKMMIEMMLKGFEMSNEFTMPGEVVDAGGLDKNGRTAGFSLNTDKLADQLGKENPGADMTSGKIVSKPEGDLSAELAAFKAEMDKAKADWPALKKEWEEAAAKQKAAPPEPPAGEEGDPGQDEGGMGK